MRNLTPELKKLIVDWRLIQVRKKPLWRRILYFVFIGLTSYGQEAVLQNTLTQEKVRVEFERPSYNEDDYDDKNWVYAIYRHLQNTLELRGVRPTPTAQLLERTRLQLCKRKTNPSGVNAHGDRGS